ncbi:MAG: hypothetical protein L7S63_03920 [Flavobacteriales bacterium]|nr:hypothetical protein [Flavobacteriales bacterium]
MCDDNEGEGCTDASACNYDSDPTTDTNNTLCTYVDGVCDTCVDGLIVDNDADNDGVCDDNEIQGCTDPAACNYDSDPTTDTNNTLCTYVDGVCDTCVDGLIVDNDADNDGVCDDNEVEGCTDATACNYDSDPTTDTNNTLCTYVDGVCETCVDGLIVDNDADNDGVCDDNEVEGCTDPAACNYDSDPTTDTNNTLCTYVDGVCDTCVDGLIVDNDADNDGVCDDNEVEGCTDATACNYDSDPTTDTNNTLCTYVDGVCDTCVDGLIVDNDADNDGVCDDNEVEGCTDATACNYDSDPTTDTNNTLCTYVTADCESCINGQVILNDADEDGICDEDEVAGCTDPSACNAGDFTDTDNSLCAYADDNCESCLNGSVILSDADNDGVCDENEVEGCTDATACNYDSTPTTDTNNTLCTYVDGVCDTCVDGLIVDNDADNDGVCDDNEVQGCTDPEACNYDSNPTTDTNNTLCTYVDGICDSCVDGQIVDNDADNDGVCDDNEVQGCTDPEACNYDSDPTTDTDNTLCTYVDGVCETCVDGQIVDNDADNDGVCDGAEAEGCTDPEACNYDSDPTTDTNNTLCTYVDGICETCVDGQIVDNDADNDGVCDDNEVEGCTDATACNYDSDPTTDTNNTLCTYVDGVCDTCVNGQIVDNDADNDGVCDGAEVQGCTDPAACNYDSDPTTDTNNTLCTYVDGVCETCVNGEIVDNDANDNGICDNDEVECPDFNNNDICDGDEIFGCTYGGACNFDLNATADDGSCVYANPGFDCDGNDLGGADLFYGCTYPEALNYSAAADIDNGSCTFLDVITDIGPCYFDVTNDGVVNTPDLLILLQYWESTCVE